MGKMFLVLVDAHSKWPEVFVLESTTSKVIIQCVQDCFARFGLPTTMVSDNGPQFVSEEFQTFLRNNGIAQVTSAPYHPATNGLAERFIQTMKNYLRKTTSSHPLRTRLSRFLLSYRNTRHPTTRESPAQLMLQRHLRTRLDLLKPSVADCVASAHYRPQRQHPGQERAFTAGDQVYARDYRSGHKWQPGTVAAQTGPVSFQVQVSQGRVWRRHQDQLLRAPSQDSGPSESRPDETGGVSATAWTDSTPEDSAGDRCLPQASLPAPSEVPRPRSNTQDAETLRDADNSDGERRYPVRDRRKPRRLIEE
ncbi:uncharacterized protein K02A2.6-like [Ixodes scapularis]|uniref:uncharacterized protein K02A2.6-like n=1 Tax=Ixodes scapularis TaxID=6945 RepID=UPI001C3880CD|nr:uncharacterized protein K02A2.6-like [Ixodes scapularis]